MTSINRGASLEINNINDKKKRIYVWATWCPPCTVQNKIIKFYEELGIYNKNDLVKISIDKNERKLRKYLQQNNMRENSYIHKENQFFGKKIIKGTPSIIYISEKGEIQDIKTGISFFF